MEFPLFPLPFFPRFVAIGKSSSGHSVLAAAALCRGVAAGAEGQARCRGLPCESPRWDGTGDLGGNVPSFGRTQTPQIHLQPLPSWRKALICGARPAPPPHLVKPLTPAAQSVAGKHRQGFGLNIELTKTSLSSKAQPERALPQILIMRRVSSRGD